MRMARILAVVAIIGLAGATPAGAQEAGSVGLTMGYPASVGVLWRANDRVAIRPELSLAGSTSDSGSSSFGSSFTVQSEGWALGTGVTVLFTLKKYDNLRTYFGPRFTYTRTSSTSESSGFVTTSEDTTTSTSVGGAGLFGAQYSLGSRFAVFGELGFGFARSTTKLRNSDAKFSGNSWGTRTGAGVIFFP
jgi:hypothetical protein